MNQNHEVLNQQLTFSNTHFWHWFIFLFRGFDEVKELNLDEVLQDVIGLDLSNQAFEMWYQSFLPSDSDTFRNHRFSAGSNIQVDIEFAQDHINYYFNDLYIGNLSGHFEAWFFTLDEFLGFKLDDQNFLLLLPMLGVEHQQISEIKIQISKRLQHIIAFQGHEEYIAGCIVNGLKMNQEFYKDKQVGICNRQNHSIRNIELYPEGFEHIQKLNQMLS
ncbi:Imm19 family immunity protein [Acinetobacter wuhouensis]|uniref:Immunity protein 19 n=1 Tax=Acinetobacter wuhouensis TaxID=1879050 RepID=A0A4Q7AMR5_9GAMM|nr:Imm19 family immunity protein [Acinetobacter wuhouensis]RZG48016.1 hypothetical protein EXU28_04405 [Acinetobacter wuhouensis]RZG75541.1 hypothetical protein EXU29_01395 [Acinetobacter wuhouensis]